MERIRLIFGVETEWMMTAPEGETDRSIDALIAAAAGYYSHLPAVEREGRFFPCGLLYRDPTGHLETATAECCSPTELVRAEVGMRRIVRAGAETFAAREHTPVLSRVGLDYQGADWGMHENYSLHKSPERFLYHPTLAAFLATRPIYGGAGGLRPDSLSEGIRFSLSPRLELTGPYDDDTFELHSRSMLTLRESLARTVNRLHVVCGESLCSQFGLYLRVGATALVVYLLDRGIDPIADLRLKRPVQTAYGVAADPLLKSTFATNKGRMGAIAVQRHFLDGVRRNLAQLPDWSAQLATDWERTLDRLEQGPSMLESCLDWPLKWRLFQEITRGRHDMEWEDAVRTSRRTPHDPAIQRLCNDLIEADILFSAPDGLFAQLDAAGQLRHRLPDIENIEEEECVVSAPTSARAAFRGRFIRDHVNEGLRYRMDWDHILDRTGEHRLSMGDPFQVRQRWKADRHNIESELGINLNIDHAKSSPEACERLHQAGVRAEAQGNTPEAEDLYTRLQEMAKRVGNTTLAEHARWHLGQLYVNSGRYEEAGAVLEPILHYAGNAEDLEENQRLHLKASLLLELRIIVAAAGTREAIDAVYRRALPITCAQATSMNASLERVYRDAVEDPSGQA